MRIGVYSGSFDPIHTGHAMLANYVAQWGRVDEVWLMVSRLNPLKAGHAPAEDRHRLAMAALVAAKCRCVEVSDFELSLPLPSYTYVTLCKLRERYPEHEFVLVIGSDNLLSLDKWRNADDILRQFGMIVYPRPGYELPDQLPEGVEVLGPDVPEALVSSTFIRDALAQDKDICYFVPSEVAEYIKDNNLYKN